ncbi:MAG: protein kinase [Myxococcales bacterium]|nr:protein kinase [Myxococcales bacterium]
MTQSFGKYQLEKKLATGGMAEVWLARQTGIEGFNRHIVVKRILAHLAEDPEFVAMFLQEARIASRFNHPNIAQIYDLGENAGTFFIAMEFIHGEDLGRVMRRAWSTGQWVARPLAIRIVADSAAGLYYAHTRMDEQGRPLRIVHRDISPQNILVSFDGSVKLVDFGIAKAADQVSNTKSGAIKGKFAYMAPEQAGGKPLDARTDIFALGLVLYELITGVRPLKRDSEIGTLQAALECAIEKPSQVAEVPNTLDDVVMRALAKDPEDRYRDARQFQMALEQFLVQEGTVATSVQVSELMETIFADRLREEARLGAPAPASESSVSNPVAEPAQPLYEDKPSNTQLASNPGGPLPQGFSQGLAQSQPPRPAPPGPGPGSTRDEEELAPDLSPHDDGLPEDGDDSLRVGGFHLPAGTVMPSRSYATSIARRPSAPEMEAARAPRRGTATRLPVRNDSTSDDLEEVPDREPEESQSRKAKPRKNTSSSMPEAPARKSRPQMPSAKASPPPRKSKLFDKSEVSKLVDVREMKARQSSRLNVLIFIVALGGLITLGVLFKEQLKHIFFSTPNDRATPILLSVATKPRVHVQVIPPPDAVGRQRVDLGETPLDRVSGAFVNDTILLVSEDRFIRYEEKFEFGQPNETKTIRKEFEEGTIAISISPPLKGAAIYRGQNKIGQVGMNIKLMEGHHELEVRADSLEKPFPFEVTLKPREFVKKTLDLSSKSEKAPTPK